MATTLPPPKAEELEQPERPGNGSTGNGGWQNLVPADGNLRTMEEYSPPPASSAIWVALAGISMTFAAFTSALIVRQGSANDWRHITLPPVLYLNTLVIVASSFTLEIARRRVAAFMGSAQSKDDRDQAGNPVRWLYLTLFLGLLFMAGQAFAW